MREPGQIVLFRFPQTDLVTGKLRPALLLHTLPGRHRDVLICMISSRLHQAVEGFDDHIEPTDVDFEESGLKAASLIRVGRLAVVEDAVLIGQVGRISNERLHHIRRCLADWLAPE